MLYIMRHGRTDWNDRHKLQGRTDIPLNDAGRKMAREAAKEYEQIHFDICFCSPLIRAQETARLFLEDRDVEIRTDDRLAEMCFGMYEGIENSFQIPDCPINVLFQHPEKYTKLEGAESFAELFARTGDFLKSEVEPRLQAGQNVLIVGHGAMNLSIICQRKGIPIERFWETGIENCKLYEI